MNIIYPKYLQPGDTIGITCPAGYMAAEKAETCIATLKQWGYKVKVGKTLGSKSTTYFSGTDAERTRELQSMMDDPKINAILCGRGGYGFGRIIDSLDFTAFEKSPKWLIGFSDITIFHTHVFHKYGIASIHGPMAAAFNDGGDAGQYIASLKNTMEGKNIKVSINASSKNIPGEAEGILFGGNLTLLANVIGTESDFDTTGKIFFIEEIGEYLYSADRMLHQLKRAGKFEAPAAVIIGGFTDMKDTERPFGKSITSIITEAIGKVDYPVVYNFPVSHDAENIALKIGGRYRLEAGKKKVVFTGL